MRWIKLVVVLMRVGIMAILLEVESYSILYLCRKGLIMKKLICCMMLVGSSYAMDSTVVPCNYDNQLGIAMRKAINAESKTDVLQCLEAGWPIEKCLPVVPVVASVMHSPRTSLTQAVGNNSLGMVQFLLDRGAQVDGFDGYQHTPLMVAAQESREMVALLIKSGAEVTLRNSDCLSALYFGLTGNLDVRDLLGEAYPLTLAESARLAALSHHQSRQMF